MQAGIIHPKPKLTLRPASLVIPRMTKGNLRGMKIRDRLAPPPIAQTRLEAQHLRWGLRNIYTNKMEQEGECHNLVLDQVGDLLASYSFQQLIAYAIVSTDSTTPAASDTSIPSEVARTNTVPSGEDSTLTRDSDGVYIYTRTVEFDAEAVANQDLTKWGFAATNTEKPSSEGLFKDGSNNPVTITPNGAQALRLTYAIKITLTPVMPTAFTAFDIDGWVASPVTGNMSLKGNQDASGGYTTNHADLDVFTALTSGSGVERSGSLTVSAGMGEELDLTYNNSNGNGATAARGAVTIDDYVAGSNQRTASVLFGSGVANDQITSLMLGISFNVQYLGAHYWDCGLGFDWDSGYWDTKVNTKKLTIEGFGFSVVAG